VTTSGITSWPLTAEEIVTQAMIELGAIASGETPTGEEMEDGLIRLNAMLKTWGGEGNLFRETTATLVIPAATGAGTLPAGVRDVSSVRHVVSSSYSRQLAEWNRGQYYSRSVDLLSFQEHFGSRDPCLAGAVGEYHARVGL
jgi:hypothetical protein